MRIPNRFFDLTLDQDGLQGTRAVPDDEERDLTMSTGRLHPATHGDRLTDMLTQPLDIDH